MAQSADYVNFRTCCRLCLAEDCQVANIFSTKNRPSNLVEKIFSVIGIKVTIQDRITTNLCDKCFLYVNNYDNFKNICLINQVKLAKQLSVFEAQLINESIQIKDEPVSDDDVVFVPPQLNNDTLEVVQDDELPPILSPNLPTAEMLRSLEVQTIEEVEQMETIETIETIAPGTPPISIEHHPSEDAPLIIEVQEKPPEDNFRVPEAPSTPKRSMNDSRDKIDFAATLNLAKKMDNVNMEPFTRTEEQYAMRMRIIFTQVTTLRCGCHNKWKPTMKSLLSHIKKYESAFLPPYTCPHCCTTFTRSGFAKHRYPGCKHADHRLMYDVANIVERGINKHRNYQSFKCKICLSTARVLEGFVQHVDDHIANDPNMVCHCEKMFSNAAAFKQHMLSSCVMKPSCDMCDIMFDTVDEFKKHCEDEHDDKEGETFNLDDTFNTLELPFVALYACVECNLKCKQELFLVRHLQKEHGYDLDAAKRVGVDCYIGSQNGDAGSPQNQGHGPTLLNNNESFDESEESNSIKDSSELVTKITGPRVTDEQFMESAFRPIKPNLMECQICFKTFSNASNVRKHLRQAHLMNHRQTRMSSYSCGNCDASFLTMPLLQSHLLSEHIHTCIECGKKCESVEELDRHRSSHLKISLTRDPKTHNYRSSAGGNNDDDMPVLQSIDAQDIKLLTMKCKLCDRLFATSRGLSIHMKRQHYKSVLHRDDMTSFPQRCSRKGCHVLLKSVTDWSLHMQMHAESENASSGSNSPALPDDTDYFTCKKCFKVFANKGNLKQHMKTHGVTPSPPKGKRYFCSICKYVCSSNAEWAKHKQSHLAKSTQSNKSTLCKYCKVAFEDERKLFAHMSEEHALLLRPREVKPELITRQTWDCEVCGKKMPSKDSLRGHIGWHKRTGTYRLRSEMPMIPPSIGGVNPFEPKVTISETPATLNINKQHLFKDKTFICITCGTLFPSAASLQTHQTTLHGKMRCNKCWKYFNSHADLTEHVRIAHVKPEPQNKTRHEDQQYQHKSKKMKKGYEYCKICGAEFGGEEELRDHMQDAHPGIPFLPKGCCVCPICDDEFRNMAALSSHVRMHQRRGDTVPLKVRKQSNKANKIQLAPKIVPPAPVGIKQAFKYSCGICKRGYDQGPDLRKHILEMHPF